MNTLIFATNNQNKKKEVTAILANKYKILSLEEIGFLEDIPETALTLEGNASLKAWHIFNHYNQNCFADDTGLEVEALNGEPGVFSARYAGSPNNFIANIDKLLYKLHRESNRKARFRTVVSLIIEGKETLFEGIINGEILTERKGIKGFGYDSIFIPTGYTQTFAEMETTIKNNISHRALAMNKMAEFLAY